MRKHGERKQQGTDRKRQGRRETTQEENENQQAREGEGEREREEQAVRNRGSKSMCSA